MIQKRKKFCFALWIVLIAFGGWLGSLYALKAEGMVMPQDYEGYLTTSHSVNMHDDPEKITKECILMPECAASGYGISVKQADGTYKFYKFDAKGQDLAKDILDKTRKAAGIWILASGILNESTLKISALSEKIKEAPVVVELTGWLIDKCCSGTTDPVKHTLKCLQMESCAASGYGILVSQTNGSYKFYKFDPKGHNLAVEYVKKSAKKDNITIKVKGTWDGDILKVSSFTERN
jgi:hypothetical protein